MALVPESEMDLAAAEAADASSSHATNATSRRSFFFMGAAAAAAMVPARARAQPRTARPRSEGARFQTVQQQEVPVAPIAWSDPKLRLLRRATYGPTEADVASIRASGYQGWLTKQLNYTTISDTQAESEVAARYVGLSWTVDQASQILVTTVAPLLEQATLHRAVFSKRQLYQRMVEFWSDHFNIYARDAGYLKIIDDRDVIRKHALGRFGDLLKASTKSPAMLAYLDQTQSRVGRPNENYARELMELHTLGVDGGYSQTDVAELARVLTGWSLRGRGEFYFDPSGHDWGTKTVLGLTIPAGSASLGVDGVKEGERIIDLLLAHPSTARFISTKMLKWLLTSEPSETQIRTIAGVFRSTGGDIKSMVRAILNEGWVAAAPARYKRPFHYVASGLRALGVTAMAMNTVSPRLATLGQPLFMWETPDGYPDSVEWWSGNITPRWAYAIQMSEYRAAPIFYNTTLFVSAGVDGAIELMNKRFFAGEIAPGVRTLLRSHLAAGALDDVRVRETIGLALATSDFQWY